MASVDIGPPVERQGLAKIKADREQQARAAGEAQTAGLPSDWLTGAAAGAGAGWIFGPVGGVIGLAVGSMLSKRRRKGILANAAADVDSNLSLHDSVLKQINIAEQQAKTDQDRAELALRREQVEGLAPFLAHPNPEARIAAMQQLMNISPDLAGELDEIEAAQLARESLALEKQEKEFAKFDNLAGDLQRESSKFIVQRDSWRRAQALYKERSQASDIGLIYAYANLLDPGAIVTEGDTQLIQATGNISEQAAGWMNSFITGDGSMDDTVRDNLMRSMASIYKSARTSQMEINQRYGEIAETAGVGPELRQQLRIPIDPSESALLARLAGSSKPVQKAPPSAIEGLAPQPENPFVAVAGGIGEAAGELIDSVGRKIRGERLYMDAEGQRFVKDAEGNITQIESAEQFIDADGNTIERIELEDGSAVFRLVDDKRQRVGRRTRGQIKRQRATN